LCSGIPYYSGMSDSTGIGVGIIGLGFMGRTHLQAFNACPGCRVVAVSDRNPDCLDGSTGGGGNFETGAQEAVFDPATVACFLDAHELIAHPDVQLVSVTTPTPTHKALAVAVMEAGKHLLLEKPVDLDPVVIDELAAIASEQGVLAMPAHCMRFWPAWAWMKARLDEGTYGRALRASFHRTGAAPGWNQAFYFDDAQSGGAIVDLHIHDVDFIVHAFGAPQAVFSSGSRRHVRTDYTFEGTELEVSAEGGWLDDDSPFSMKCTIECEMGTMDFDLSRSPELQVQQDGTLTDHPEASEGGTGYDGEVAAIVNAIQSAAASPPVRLADAALVARVLVAEIDSLTRGEKVVLR